LTENELVAGEVRIEQPDMPLWRQIHPRHLGETGPDFVAFNPTSADDHCLSIARGSAVDAEEAHRRHVARGRLSAGTWSVTVAEVEQQDLRAVDDSRLDGRPEEHGYIDYRLLSTRAPRKMAAIALARAATARGRRYPPAAA
jgi:hypothetical protein